MFVFRNRCGNALITTWQLTLPGASSLGFAQLDWNSITDVVLRFRYTARDGGSTFAAAAGDHDTLRSALNLLPNASATGTGVTLAWSARRDFPNEWHLAQTSGPNLDITLTTDLLPYWMQGLNLAVNRINAWYVPIGTLGDTGTPAATWTPAIGSPTSFSGSWTTGASAALASLTPTSAPSYTDNTELSVDPGDLSLEPTYVVDLILVLQVTTS